eukprot:709122-Karenia_brevis.AAC.1
MLSAVETDAENAAEDPCLSADQDDLADEEGANTERASPGTFNVEQSAYFTYSQNPAWTDIRVRMRSRWATDDLMGSHPQRSKTVTPANFGETTSIPTRSML